MQPSFGEEEGACMSVEVWAVEVSAVPLGIEAWCCVGLLHLPRLWHADAVVASEPHACLPEVLSQHVHGQVYDVSMCLAREACVGVSGRVEVEAGVTVVVKGAQGSVSDNGEPQLPGYFFYGE
jgi:hypothetical protein